MNKEIKSISTTIAGYASSIEFNDIPQEVVHEVKRRLIDSFGCALGAFSSKPAIAARMIGKKFRSEYGSTIFGTKYKTSPDFSTLSTGILFRYLDYNDTYLSKEPAHPSDNIPAAIAIAEAENSNCADLITAITIGYEIQCRLCDAASLRSKGWDHVGYVSIASAVLASKLLKMDSDKTEHAIALSIAPNVALRQTRVGELSMWKGCAAANAARNGVFAAMLASAGITGPSEVFEGEMGFFNQVTGSFKLDTNQFGGNNGKFKILDSYIKYYPSEYHSQAGIEAALLLRDKIKVEDIHEINIETYDACVDIIAGDKKKWNPQTRETADHSLPYCVAVALFDGKVGLDQFDEERIKDPELIRFLNKIKVKRNPEHSKQYPESFPCLIEIRSNTGEIFSELVTYPKGHPENPLSDEELEEKFIHLNNGRIRNDKVNEIFDKVWNLDKIKNVNEIISLFEM